MKKIITTLIILTAVSVIAFTYPGGAPANKVGSPAFPSTCTSCHSGGSNTMQTGWITSNVPAAGYTPGTTYTITATATYSGRSTFGFEISPQSATGVLQGTMINTNTAQTQILGTGLYITHTTGGISGTNSKTWSFNWTAPAAGTGSVTFYGAFLCADGDGTEMGDETYKSTLTIAEAVGCLPPAQPGTISGSASVCSAASQTYSVAAVTGATSYGWTLPSGWSGTSTTNSITVTTGSSSGTISVVATNSCGNSTPRTLAVTVNANPTATITASGPTTFCQGGNVTLTSSSGSSYLWSPGGATTQSITVSTAGSYTVHVTNASGCSATSAATVVTVNASGIPTISASGPTTFCQGGSVTLTTAPASSYLWSPGGATTQSITVSTSGSYTVAVTGTCPGTSAPTVVTVNTAVIPTITANGPTTFCLGGSVVLSTSATGSYLWNPGGATTQSISATSSGSYTVTVTGSGAGTCPGTSSPTVVTVNPVTIASLASFTPACSSDPAFALTGGSPAGGVYSGTGVSGGMFDPSVSGVGTFNITYTYTNASGCTNSAFSSMVVNNCTGGGCTTAPPAPGAITGPVTGICNQSGIVYSISSVATATSYNWTVPANCTITNNTGTSITVTYLPGFTSGNISVTATNACGTSPASQLHISTSVIITDTISGPKHVCRSQDSVMYSIPTVPGAISYQWVINNGATLVASGNTAMVDFTHSIGRYIVIKVRVTTACGTSNYKKLYITVRHDCNNGSGDDDNDDRSVVADDQPQPYSVQAYPNPTTGKFVIDLTTEQVADARVRLYDIYGRVAIDQVYTLDTGLNSILVNADQVSQGLYLLNIEVAGLPATITRIAVKK